MKHHSRLTITLLALLLFIPVASPGAGLLDELFKRLDTATSGTVDLDETTIVKGLREALSTGTARAVTSVSKQDGYFANQTIKILLPEKLRTTADLLAKFGFRQEVDDFVLAMNRAAEKAAPQARDCFLAALKEMTFADARKILNGEETAATEYFRLKTSNDIYGALKPVVAARLQEVGAVRSYQQLTERVNSIPFAGRVAVFDLDHYVTDKAVAGLFSMLGEEEKKIRTDPGARGSQLLRQVFGK